MNQSETILFYCVVATTPTYLYADAVHRYVMLFLIFSMVFLTMISVHDVTVTRIIDWIQMLLLQLKIIILNTHISCCPRLFPLELIESPVKINLFIKILNILNILSNELNSGMQSKHNNDDKTKTSLLFIYKILIDIASSFYVYKSINITLLCEHNTEHWIYINKI